jgi:hypothetical protein
MEGTILGRRRNYRNLAGNVLNYYVLDYPEKWDEIPEQYHDRLFEALDDLGDVLASIASKHEPSKELVGVKNALACLHDTQRIYRDIGITPPQFLAEIERELVCRRDELDPGQSQVPQR